MKLPKIISVAVVCWLLSFAYGANAAEPANVSYVPGPKNAVTPIVNGEPQEPAPMPCVPKKTLKATATRLVAECDDKPGLLIIDTSVATRPRPLEVRGYEGKLKQVYMVGEEVWVDIDGGGSRPLTFAEIPPVEPTEKAEAPKAEPKPQPVKVAPTKQPPAVTKVPPPKLGRVLTVDGRNVVIDLGKQDGFFKGDTVEFFTEGTIVFEGESVRREDTVALGLIRSVTKGRAVVEISLNVDLPPETQVRRATEEFKPNYLAPPHPSASHEVSLTVRPFLALGTIGGGAIMDASYTYRFDFPMSLDLVLSPVGFALADEGNAVGFAGHAILSYDENVFQIGLGIGAARYEEETPYEVQVGQEVPDTMRFGFSAAQHVRLGTRDGMNLTATTNFVIQKDGFEFGGMSGSFQVPMSPFLPDTWLIMRGGGGLPGHAFGEIGVRALIAGNGSSGSVFLTPTLGGGFMSNPVYKDCDFNEGQCRTENEYGGPMAGLTVEWRP